jgi:hypothetical protein
MNPKPAANQIWNPEPIGGWGENTFGPTGECVIERVDRHRVYLFGRRTPEVSVDAETMHGTQFWWRCVGLQTPAGRVMVGEKRTCLPISNHPMEIVRVVDDSRVTVRFVDGTEADFQAAKIAATWSVL